MAVLLLSALLWLSRPAHDFHVSKCLAHYDTEEQALQMSMHIFIDDLELALAQEGHENLFLCTPKEVTEAEAYLKDYLRRHFKLSADGTPLSFDFIGKEISDDLMAVWCYLEVTGLPRPESLEVEYSILLNTYDDQKNILSLDFPGEKPGMLFFQKGQAKKTAALGEH